MVRRSVRTAAKNAETSTPETEASLPPSASSRAPRKERKRPALPHPTPNDQGEQAPAAGAYSGASSTVKPATLHAAPPSGDLPAQSADGTDAHAAEAAERGGIEAEMKEHAETAAQDGRPGAEEWYLILTEDAMAVLRAQQNHQNAPNLRGAAGREGEGKTGDKTEAKTGDKREREDKGEGPKGGSVAALGGNDSSVVGPVSAETIRIYFQHCLVDGYTQCWKSGMAAWSPLCATEELKKVLQEEEEDLEPTEGGREDGEKAASSARVDAIPPEFKYVTPEGVQMVFDEGDKTWRTAEEYEALYSLLAEADALPSASSPGEKPSSGVSPPLQVREEDMVFPGLAAVEEEAGTEGEGKEGAGDTRELTEAERQKKEINAEKRRLYRQRLKKKKQEGRWVVSRKNPNIYVSNLPPDCTEAELAEIFKKAGVFKIDPDTLQPKIRVYADDAGRCKGDALISFVHENSVDIAIKYFDGFAFRDGACTLKVQRAEFAPKAGQGSSPTADGLERGVSESRPGKRDRRKYLAAKYEQERLLSWGDAVDDGTGRRIIILKPTYSSEEAELYEEGDAFYEELRQELFDEIAQFAKPEKVTVIPRHVQGVACVKLKTAEDAERIIEQFRGRYFDGRQLDVFFFDGRSDLKANCLPSRLAKKPKVLAPISSQSSSEAPRSEGAGQNEGGMQQEDHELQEGKDDEAARLDKFGDWINQQSSDEEFEVQTEE